jgi:hypothetical protein
MNALLWTRQTVLALVFAVAGSVKRWVHDFLC